MNILCYDIETLKEDFLVRMYIPDTNLRMSFSVNKNHNQIEAFVEFAYMYEDYYWVGYNNLRFDSQVIEYILRNYHNWHQLGWKEICKMIYQKATDTIDDANYDIFPEYRENQLSFKQIDLFLIWHFNNENRRTSLKALEFSMRMENIEEIPIPIAKEDLSDEEITRIEEYCDNDVTATYSLWKMTIGDTENPLYKGENKIEDRLNMQKEFGLSCLNWDNVKIGSEWNKMDYIQSTGRRENDLKPRKIVHIYGKSFRQFFPNTVEFQTPALRKFIRDIGSQFVKNEFQEFEYKFNDELVVTVAKGGLHSNEKGRFIKPDSEYMYFQVDVGSQYPNAIRKYGIEPKHLPGWNKLITSKIDRRLHYKKLYQETGDRKYNSLQKMGKDALNGGAYGRLNTRGDWQEYPYGMLQVTMGCQLEILMVIEILLLRGYRIVSINTDGFDAIILKEKEKDFRMLLKALEKKIGNEELGNFELTEFKWIVQTSVSDYLAMKSDGTLKAKGDFEWDKELHKNSSARIVPIVLREYFVNDVPVEKTIRDHKDVYDFCIRQKASSNFHYEGVSEQGTRKYNKLIRYYVSNKGEKMFKIKNPECTTKAPSRSRVEAGDVNDNWLCTVCNFLPRNTKMEDTDVNFEYYIRRAEKIISKIDKKYTMRKNVDKAQLTLW